MKTQPLWRVAISTTHEAEDAVANLLERIFNGPASIYAPADGPASTVAVFLSQPAGIQPAKRQALRAGLDFLSTCELNLGPAQVVIRKVKREDWSESWKKNFRAIEIGSALLVKPSWDKRKPRKGAAVVRLDPGLSFGTGQHPTTAFCLEQIVQIRNADEPQALLDLGTGSGILAVAAVKLGYHPVRAIDNDPAAVRVAQSNAQKNRVAHKVEIVRSDLSRRPAGTRAAYDVICANLTCDHLIQACQGIVDRLRPGGKLVLAGILAGQFREVRERYVRAGLVLETTRIKGEWQSARFGKRR